VLLILIKNCIDRCLPILKSRQLILRTWEALEALEKTEVQEIHRIEAALQRIAEDTYGICDECGADIDPKRLKALPTASKCILCAA